MKLKNKKTGDIIETLGKISFVEKQNNGLSACKSRCFDSIDLLNEEWEDVPKERPFEETVKAKYEIITLVYHDLLDEDIPAKETRLEIADRDYYESLPDGSKKTKFTYNEASQIQHKIKGGWRLPTIREWRAICDAFGDSGPDYVSPQKLKEALGLDRDGLYWTSSLDKNCNDYAYTLYLNFLKDYTDSLDVTRKSSKLSVRFVRGGER